MMKIIKKSLVILILVLGIFTLTACGNNRKALVGSWKNDTDVPGFEFVYTFNADGTGSYDVAGVVMKFTYTINGNKISFKYIDQDLATYDTTYSIKDGVLNIKDSNNEDTLYQKVK